MIPESIELCWLNEKIAEQEILKQQTRIFKKTGWTSTWDKLMIHLQTCELSLCPVCQNYQQTVRKIVGDLEKELHDTVWKICRKYSRSFYYLDAGDALVSILLVYRSPVSHTTGQVQKPGIETVGNAASSFAELKRNLITLVNSRLKNLLRKNKQEQFHLEMTRGLEIAQIDAKSAHHQKNVVSHEEKVRLINHYFQRWGSHHPKYAFGYLVGQSPELLPHHLYLLKGVISNYTPEHTQVIQQAFEQLAHQIAMKEIKRKEKIFEEVGRITGISPATIRDWMNKGKKNVKANPPQKLIFESLGDYNA